LCRVPLSALPVPALLVGPAGEVRSCNALAAALGLDEELPASWQSGGPLLAAWTTGAAASGPVPGWRTEAPPVHWRCTPADGGVLCVQGPAPAPVASHDRQRFLEEVTTLSRVGGWELLLEAQKLVWSERVFDIHEVPRGELPDLDTAFSFYAPEARPVVRAAVEEGSVTGKEWDLELPFITAKGRRIWVRTRGRPIIENGRCVRLLGTFEDITARIEAQQATQAALQRTRIFAELFRNSNGLLAVANLEGRFVHVNAAWTELLGWSEEELTARPFLDFVHPEDRARTIEETRALVGETHRTVDFHNRYRTAAGDYVELVWTATSDPDTGSIYSVARDVTAERRQTERLERLATIAARTINSVQITNVRGELEWVNESFISVTGYTLAEVKGRAPGELLQGPDTDPATVALMREGIRAGQETTAEVLNYRKDGSPFWHALEIQPMHDAEGRLTGFMGIGTEITERRAAQQELIRERDRAEQLARDAHAAAQAKSDFLAMMSHELRTPLNGILGTAQLLLDGSLHPDHHALIEILHGAGKGLLSLLNDVLDYSKLDSGHFVLVPRPLDLVGVAQDCVALFQAEAQRLGLELELVLGPGLPSRVVGDELRLRQVLSNLLGNALKFTERGHVHLELRRLPDDRLRFAVVDTGIGIGEEQRHRLFAPFTQVDSSSRRRAGGTGLGLSISQRLVQLMGGTISLRSEVGQGSTFWFDVELEEAEQAPARAPVIPEEAVGRGEVVVLLAEDNAVNRLVGTKLLERVGCRVVVAKDGAEAVAAASEQPIDLVLMDCHMPEVDGWEATRELRRLGLRARSGRSLPVVAQTASCLPQEVQRCLDAGMDEVLAKPLDLLRLRSVVSRWAGGGTGAEG
jgi:PAS domain S-box-containing protein